MRCTYHEVENNYATNASETGVSPEDFAKQRAMAYRAWWEFMPTRLAPPAGSDYKIYRDLSFGKLAHFFVLDGRQYRTDQACGDAILKLEPPCDELGAPDRTMLGAEQESWLLSGLGTSSTTWNAQFPDLRYLNVRKRGWCLNEVTPSKWTATFRIVDDATKSDGTVTTDATFTVTPDKPGASRV
jgi:phosphodiesterase/alkaline phosphatase D-like protein